MGIRVSRSSMDEEEEPPLNLAHEDEDQSESDANGAGPLAWLGVGPAPQTLNPCCSVAITFL